MKNFFDKLTDFLDDVLLSEELQNMLDLANRFLVNGNNESATSLYQRIIQAKPDYVPAYYKLALSYYYAKNYAEAIKALSTALELRSRFKEARNLLGLCYLAQGKYDAACAEFREAIKIDPEESNFYYNLATACIQNGKYDLAVKELKKATRLNPSYAEYYNVLGEAYLHQENFSEAQRAFQNAILNNKEHEAAYVNLGITYLKLGNYELAQKKFQRALQLNKFNYRAKYNLAKVFSEQKNYEEAINLFTEIREKFPEANDDLGLIYLEKGNIHQGIYCFEEALEANPQLDSPKFHLAQAYKVIQRFPEAKNLLEKLLHKNPNFPEAYMELAEISFLENKLSEAENYLQKAKKIQPNSAKILVNLGKIKLKKEDYEGAVDYFKEALKQEPDNLDISKILEKTYREWDEKKYEDHERSDKLYSVLTKTLDKLNQHPQLSDFAVQVAGIRESLDLPLLITIMGEFNTGKSTFINSLIGEKIAPMGIRPTTATINYLKYGSMRKLRILWRNGEVEEAEITKLREYADEKFGEKRNFREIKLVEILYPLEILKEVNIVDTPGLNVSLKEHEEVTKGFVEGADAVLWLFSVDQAGKKTEKEALEFLQQFSKKTVGVVNKIDLASAEEITEIKRHLQQELEKYLAGVVPLSAKKALKGKVDSDKNLLEESGFSDLENILKDKIFQHSRMLKIQSIRTQLSIVFDRINLVYQDYNQRYSEYFASIENLRKMNIQKKKYFENEVIPCSVKKFKESITGLYGKISHQIVENTISKGFFSLGEISDEDKDYIRKLARKGFEESVKAMELEVEREIGKLSKEMIFVWEANFEKANLKTLQKFPLIFSVNHESKLTILRESVFDSIYMYYRGYADAGAIEDAIKPSENYKEAYERLERFHPLLVENLIQEKIYAWLDEYFDFLEEFCQMTEEELKEIYIDAVETVFKPLERYSRELANPNSIR